MADHSALDLQQISKYVGWSLITIIAIGIVSAMSISSGIDINLSADISKTAENMLGAQERLRGKAYIALFLFMLEVFFSVGLFIILRESGVVIATWSLFLGVSSGILALLGAVYMMNVAMIAGNSAFDILANKDQRLLLTSLQVTSDYTSFHLSLVLSSAAKAGIFLLFLKSRLIPKLISGWGLFASLFVAITIVVRDFIPLLGNTAITSAFMVSNLVALLALGLYLGIRGIRISTV